MIGEILNFESYVFNLSLYLYRWRRTPKRIRLKIANNQIQTMMAGFLLVSGSTPDSQASSISFRPCFMKSHSTSLARSLDILEPFETSSKTPIAPCRATSVSIKISWRKRTGSYKNKSYSLRVK